MPKKNLSDAEMTALVTFTMSLFYPDFSTDFYSLDLIKEFKGGRKPLSGESAWKILCSSCHGANGTSSVYREFERFVPALNNREFLAAASREMIAFTVRNGRGGIYMSPWAHDNGGLSDAEIESVVDYIENWKKQPPSFSDVRSTPADRVLGRTLFRSRCGTCHGMDGEGGIGPSLNNQDFLSLVSDEFLYTTIVLGRRNTAMVSWSFLSRREIAGIIGYLRSWQKTPRVHLSRRRIDGNEIEGKALYMGMCAGCHGLHGEGAVGPALFNRDFLAAASDQFILSSMRRGRSRSPMLSFAREFQGIGNLTQQEMNDITAYIRSRENDTTDIIYSTISPGTPSRGKTLYEGMCAGCHGTNGEGKHGPALNNQEFLNAATNGFLQATIALGRGGTAMRSWAKGAQGYGEMSAEDINDIVAYIRTWQKIVIPIE